MHLKFYNKEITNKPKLIWQTYPYFYLNNISFYNKIYFIYLFIYVCIYFCSTKRKKVSVLTNTSWTYINISYILFYTMHL
jgi:hypothetical protein